MGLEKDDSLMLFRKNGKFYIRSEMKRHKLSLTEIDNDELLKDIVQSTRPVKSRGMTIEVEDGQYYLMNK